MQYKAVIFDFYGVVRTEVYDAWLAMQGHERTGEYHDLSVQMDRGIISYNEFLEQLAVASGVAASQIDHELRNAAPANPRLLQLISRVREAGVRTALLSNAPADLLMPMLDEHNLQPYFDQIVVSSDIGMIKPSPEIYEYTLQKLDVSANQAIFIDDNPTNVAGAERVGIVGIKFESVVQLERSLSELLTV